jgi:uncharacterized membrane protein (DUF4010 family)
LNPAWYQQALELAAAVVVGLLIGIERGWKLRKEKSGTRVAGIRTFTLFGFLGGLAGLGARAGYDIVAGVLLLPVTAIIAIGYSRREGKDREDATTAVAALVTLGLAFLAATGSPALAVAGAAVVTFVLALRSETHRFLRRMDEADVKALARYAVIAAAVLPFLPSGHYGPYGAWNPQKLWLVVVVITGFSFLGYAANRIFGQRHGTIATALIGGAYSSTAVTQVLAQRLGSEERAGAEPAGIALATAVMYLRLPILIGILATRVLPAITILMLPALLVAWGAGIWMVRKSPSNEAPTPPGNPIALLPALGFVAFVAVASIAAAWARGRFGESGIAVLLLIVGSMDVDVAIVMLGTLPPDAISPLLAAIAIAGTTISNMAVKIGITLVYARRRGISASIAMTSSVIALAVMIGLAWTRL